MCHSFRLCQNVIMCGRMMRGLVAPLHREIASLIVGHDGIPPMWYICYWLNVKLLKIAISNCCDYTWQDLLGTAIRHETQSLYKLFFQSSTVQIANNPLKTALAPSQT